MLTDELEFEARYYLLQARRLQSEGMKLLHEADDMLKHSVLTWQRVKEVGG